MKDLNECKAEIFRRSEKRIKARRMARNRFFALCVPVVIIIAVLPVIAPMSKNNAESEEVYREESYYENNDTLPENNDNDSIPETKVPNSSDADVKDSSSNILVGELDVAMTYVDFSFSLKWGVYTQCSYDSKTGRLVKYSDSTDPDKYATYYQLTDNQLNKLNLMMYKMDIQSYPRTYSPYGDGVMSTPSDNLILTVKTGDFEKTVYALNIPIGLKAQDAKGQRFIEVCEEIKEILFNSEEWKSLPEPESAPLI